MALAAPPALRDYLKEKDNPFRMAAQGTYDNLSNGISGTLDNMRYGPMSTAASYAAAAPAPTAQVTAAAAPATPAPVPLKTPPLNTAPAGVFATPGVSPAMFSTAGGLVEMSNQLEQAAMMDRYRMAGLNFDESRPVAERTQDLRTAKNIFSGGTGGGAPLTGTPGSAVGLPAGVPVTAYSGEGPIEGPSWTSGKAALAWGGRPMTGAGGTQITATPQPFGGGLPWDEGRQIVPPGELPHYITDKLPGNKFTLRQNPNTVPGAPGYVPRDPSARNGPAPAYPGRPVAPQTPQPPTAPTAPATPGVAAQNPYERAAGAYQANKNGIVYTAENGDQFIRDSKGGLQHAGNDPDMAATAGALKTEAETDAKLTVEDAHKFLTDVSDKAESARVQSGTIKRIRGLYKGGAASGLGQPELTQLASLLSRASGKEVKVGKQQQLEKEMNTLRLERSRELMKGSGSVSNFEQELVGSSAANPSLTPQANLRILGVMQRIGERQIAMEQERIRLDDMGVKPAVIHKELLRMRNRMMADAQAEYETDVAPFLPSKGNPPVKAPIGAPAAAASGTAPQTGRVGDYTFTVRNP